MPTFGENLRKLRSSRGYSQDKFAKEIGSNQVNVSSWELGTRMPNLATIRHIADTFQVPLSSLISLESTGLEDDYVREIADLIKNNQRIRMLIDRARYLSEGDLDVLVGMAKALTKDKVEP